jgi:sugar phosphate isomerase/epimerase
MVFDTAHAQSMDGDLLNNLERGFDLIEVVQIANHPGRIEPEIGEINITAVLKRVYQLGYRGLVELEHVWTRPGLDAERRGLDWLGRADAALASVPAGRNDGESRSHGGAVAVRGLLATSYAKNLVDATEETRKSY